MCLDTQTIVNQLQMYLLAMDIAKTILIIETIEPIEETLNHNPTPQTTIMHEDKLSIIAVETMD